MNPLYAELQWLLPAPEAFSRKLKDLEKSAAPDGSDLRALASHYPDLSQLTRLAKVISRAVGEGQLLDFADAVPSSDTW